MDGFGEKLNSQKKVEKSKNLAKNQTFYERF